MPQGYDLLAVTRITGVVQTLAEELEIPGSLSELARTPVVAADEGDIFASFERNVVSADIVADDQVAVVRSGGRVALSTSAIPNLKIGGLVTQSLLNQLRRINRGGGVPGDRGLFSQYVRQELATKLEGIRILQNRMLVGMKIDSFSYKKFGIVYKNVSWGMPSRLKFVPSVPWTRANIATSTPVNDLQLYLQSAQDSDGETYNRLTISRAQFQNIVLSTNFRDHAALFTPAAGSTSTFPVNNTKTMVALFEQVTGLGIEFNDWTFKDEKNDGTQPSFRYLPDNVSYLSNTSDDNSGGTFDFAHTVVNETEVGVVPGTQVVGGGFTAPQLGPVSYATIRGDLNPPNVTLWAVERGFPRKHRATATARITMY